MEQLHSHGRSTRGASKRSFVCVLALALSIAPLGCSSSDGGAAEGIVVGIEFAEPRQCVGPTACVVALSHPSGAPVEAIEVEIEANMNHAGMVPVFAEARPSGPGTFSAEFEWTMGGDWFLLVTARLADGMVIERIIDVPGVGSESAVDSAASCSACDVDHAPGSE